MEDNTDTNVNRCDNYAQMYRSDNYTESEQSERSEKLPKKRGRPNKVKTAKDDGPKKTRGKGNNWLFVKKFQNAQEAEEAVRAENTWSIRTNRLTEEGRKQVYRCNKVKNRGPQCIAQILLLFDAYSDDVILFRKEFEHDHHLIGIRTGYYGIDPETKKAINELFSLHITKPRIIFNHLMERPGLKMPTIMQLNNYLNDLRRLKYGCSANLGKAKKWISNHTSIPENEHEAFVISYCVQESSTKICYVLSTKKLLELASRVSTVHADATNKLHWQGFELHIVGTSDADGKFYPFCLAVSSTDTAELFKTLLIGLKDAIASMYTCFFEPSRLICDCEEIAEEFTTTFGLTMQVRTCWTHVKNEVKSFIKEINETEKNGILQDVESLHFATSQNDFDVAAELFLLKWEEEQNFTNYFREEWLVKHRNWYLGAANSPITNDCIETMNKEIRDSKIIYERLPSKRFLATACDVVTEWSQNKKIDLFSTKKTVELTDWVEAHLWLKKDRKTTILNSDNDTTTYLVTSDSNTPISRTTYLQSNSSWKSFDEYKEIYFSHWKVTMIKNETSWMESKCSCPEFASKNMCKHVLGLGVQLKYATVPVEATKMAQAKEKEQLKIKEEASDPSHKSEPRKKAKKLYTLAAEKKPNAGKKFETVRKKKNLRKSRLRSEIESAMRREKSVSKINSNASWSDHESETDIKKKKRKTRAKRTEKITKTSDTFSSEQNQDFWSDQCWDDSSSDFVDSTRIDSTKKSKIESSRDRKIEPTRKVDLTESVRQDEFYFFGQSMAAQLRTLPINVALDLQVQFQNELTKARTKCLSISDNVVHSSTSVEKNPLEGYEEAVILPNKIELDDSD